MINSSIKPSTLQLCGFWLKSSLVVTSSIKPSILQLCGLVVKRERERERRFGGQLIPLPYNCMVWWLIAQLRGAVPLETPELNRKWRSYAMYLFLVVCSMYAYFVVAVKTDTNRQLL